MKKTRIRCFLAVILAVPNLFVADIHADTITNTLIVDSSGYGSDTTAMRGSTRYPYATLFKALGDAQPGDTIELRPGNHPIGPDGVHVTTRQLTIKGQGAHLKAGSGVTADHSFRISIEADDVTVLGLTIDGSPDGGGIPPASGNNGQSLCFISGKRAHFKDVNLLNGPSAGLFIYGDAQDCVIEGLISTHCYTHIFVQEGNNSSGNLVWPVGLKILHPRLSGGYGPLPYSGGIKLKDYSGNTADSRCEIVDADIDSTGDMGIEAQGSAGPSNRGSFNRVAIRGCKIYNTTFGISCAAPDMLVEGCQVKGFTYIGIEIAQPPNDRCTLVNNVLDGTLNDGTLASGGATGYGFSAGITDALVEGGAVRDCNEMIGLYQVGKVTFRGVELRPVNAAYAIWSQQVQNLTLANCTVKAPADGSHVNKVVYNETAITDPTQTPVLKVEDLNVEAIADQEVIAVNGIVSGALFNPYLDHVRCVQTFCNDAFLGSNIPLPSALVTGCVPAHPSAGQYGFVNNNGFAEGITGNTLTLTNSNYGGQLSSFLRDGYGGETHLSSIDNGVPTDALVIQHDPGYIGMHTKVPLSVDGGVMGTLPIIGQSSPPATPAAGVVLLWVDSSTGVLHAKDSNGNDHPLWGNRSAISQ